MTKSVSLYRFLAISYIALMGLIGIFRRHVGTLRGGDLFGEEAFAFGIACLGGAVLFALWDFLYVRRKRLGL